MGVSIKIREDGEFSWIKSIYEKFKNKDSFSEDYIGLCKELLGHTSQDIDKLED